MSLNISLYLICILILTIVLIGYSNYAVAEPLLNDPSLGVQLVLDGLELPTSMAFLGPDDILVLEKEKGTVQRIVNGEMLPEPLLDVNVANKSERGMLGIAVTKNETGPNNSNTYVFLYFTESVQDGNDDCPKDDFCNPGNDPLGNRLYRYELVNDKLVNPKLLLDLPTTPGFSHNAGVVTIGTDNNVYVIVGDLNYLNEPSGNTLSQNIDGSPLPDGRGGILRVTQNGEVVGGVGILGNEDPLNKYYAYGIRNSFGIAFDPLTGKLWDTENGSKHGDEINLVEPGFNSGWRQVTGMSTSTLNNKFDRDNLVDFDGRGTYSEPELDWQAEVGPTAITFLNSDKLGDEYENDLFIGTAHNNGNIYNFDLSDDRTELILNGPLADKVADNISENQDIIWGEGFDIITDLEVGSDGYLYVVSFGQGAIYRIVPGEDSGNDDAVDDDAEVSIDEEETGIEVEEEE
jgi:glucose/arabinose dehydrogenase